MSGLYSFGLNEDAAGAVDEEQEGRQGRRLGAAAVVDQQHRQQSHSSMDDQQDSQQGRHLATAAAVEVTGAVDDHEHGE